MNHALQNASYYHSVSPKKSFNPENPGSDNLKIPVCRYPKSDQQSFAAGQVQAVVIGRCSEVEPSGEAEREGSNGTEVVIVVVRQGVLERIIAVEREQVAVRPAEPQAHRIAQNAIHPVRGIAGLQVAVLKQDAVAQVEKSCLLIHEIVCYAQPRLQPVVDLERIAAVVVAQSPVVKMPEGLVQVEVKRRIKIVVRQHTPLLPVDIAVGPVQRHRFFAHVQPGDVAENI